MEHEDKDINCQESIMEDDAAGSEAPPSNGRILVKLKLPKTPEEVDEVATVASAAAAAIFPAEEIKSHYCKECNKSFSSGKALGGHMSSAHVQANKDYSYRKLNSKMKRHHKSSGSAAAADNTCRLCGKAFLSKKSLFGHMRCHPEREWRGMEPPPSKTKIDSPENSSEPESDDFGPNQDGDEDDDHIDSGSPTADVVCNLKGWPTAIKRGRGPINPVIRAPASASEEKETFVAGRQLIRLLKGESVTKPSTLQGPEFNGGLVYKKQKTGSGPQKVRIQERDSIDDAAEVTRKIENNGKGKEPQNSDTGSTMSLPDDIDSDDELYRTAIEVLMNGKRNQIEHQKRAMEEKTIPTEIKQKGESQSQTSATSPEKYTCNICKRSFPTHQALGGHRSSHNKFKLSIVNTADRKANSFKEKKQSKHKANVGDDDNIQSEERVVLGFDLNMIPEEEDKNGDGDTSNHTSNS